MVPLAAGAVSGDRQRITADHRFEQVKLLDLNAADWQIRGTDHDDVVDASGSRSVRFEGLTGDDVYTGSSGLDWYDGGPGDDTGITLSRGSNIVDTCINVEHLIRSGSCLGPQP